jgi:formate dehydrogenase iron-sulfur subunit
VTLRIFVPGDSAAVACGADEVALSFEAAAFDRKLDAKIVRNGSRGLHWLEPLVEIETPQGRIGYGPVEPGDAESVFAAIVTGGGAHP